jgi:hypothetical protein
MTDRPDFDTMLERRMRAYASTASRAVPVPAGEIARSTMAAAATPAGRVRTLGASSIRSGPRRPALLAGLAVLLLLTTVVGAAIVGGQLPTIEGVFVDGPSLSEGRIVNAVALHDGRVLVGVETEEGTVPGTTTLRCSMPCWQQLALLDPRTGEVTKTRDQPPSLDLRSMALLHDGRVLLLGRYPDGTDGPSTIYDPASDRFVEVGAPLHNRSWPLVVTLADGRVLIAGGEMFAATTAELFDPATGTFSPTGSMSRPRSIGATATPLADGRVLVVGGGAEVGTSAELFDPATDTFAPTGPTTVARGGFHSATLLADGRVLLAGGLVPDAKNPQTVPDPTASAEVYDPATGTFAAVGPMAVPRFMQAASILADGTVLLAGGAHHFQPEGVPVMAADAEIFDPSSGSFRPTGSLHRARLWPVAVSIDERVLVLGQLDPSDEDLVAGRSSEWFH